MVFPTSGVLVAAAGFALAAGGAISLLLARWTAGRDGLRRPTQAIEASGLAAFLFEEGRLADATAPARRLLRGADRRSGDLAALLALLGDRFGPDLPLRLDRLPEGERLSLSGAGADELLEAEIEEGGAARHPAPRRLRRGAGPAGARGGRGRARAPAGAGRRRAGTDLGPRPHRRRDLGQPRLPGARRPRSGGRRRPGLLERDPPPRGRPPASARGRSRPAARRWRSRAGPSPEWLEVTSVRRGEGSVHFAADVGRLVAAETAHGAFVQTLTRTFAQLSTGLAIFDRQRRLQQFNPAFADLTGLSFAFLSGRPLVHTVLDRLREAQVAPERRDYASWRDEMAALEAASASGHHCETWTQPDGRTYRVTGRPHPDGALAFTVEDITDQIAFARRAHAELDTSRAVLDALGEAVAVFSTAGTLSLSNAAYDALWSGARLPPDRVLLGESGLRGEVERWERACGPAPLWEALRTGRTPEGDAAVAGPGGGALRARVARLPAGGLVVSFAPLPEGRDAEARPAPEGPRPSRTAPPAAAPAPPAEGGPRSRAGATLSRPAASGPQPAPGPPGRSRGAFAATRPSL